MNAHQPLTNRERVARRRVVLRNAGLRPRQFWLLDFNDAATRAEAERQSLVIAQGNSDDIEFAVAVQYWPPDD